MQSISPIRLPKLDQLHPSQSVEKVFEKVGIFLEKWQSWSLILIKSEGDISETALNVSETAWTFQ